MKTKRFRTDPATDEEIEDIWDKVFAPYDFVPTWRVSEGMRKADRAKRLLQYWRGDRPEKQPSCPHAEPEQVIAQNGGYRERLRAVASRFDMKLKLSEQLEQLSREHEHGAERESLGHCLAFKRAAELARQHEAQSPWRSLVGAIPRGSFLLRPRAWGGEYVQCWFDSDWSSEVVSTEVDVLLKQGFTEYLEVPE